MEGTQILRTRPRDSHKGDFGHLLILAGSPRFRGAPALAAAAALRTGAGLVTLATGKSLVPGLQSGLTETMFLPLPEREDTIATAAALEELKGFLPRVEAVLAGPGLGSEKAVAKLLHRFLPLCQQPLILDADALNALAGTPEFLKTIPGPVIITPHPGEFARLTGLPVADIQARRLETAQRFSRKFRVTTVLKGHQTVIAAPDGRHCLNLGGNPGLATAGTGDVLAGIIAGLVVQGLEAFTAARLGVCLHGLA
ncbi:MAG TPA: NAD(P)H-hydrate dehydratase, partial [bacterium]|nr:NAD(P)H-hydrate dehydratase [bacterium]